MANDQQKKSAGGIKGFFQKAMPFISAAAPLGGPAGTLAAGLLGKVLGSPESPVRVSPTPEGIAEALSTIGDDPALIEKGKEADQQFQLQLKQLGINSIEELEKIAAADRDSARKREIAVRDRMPMILAILVNVIFAVCIFAFLFLIVRGSSAPVNPEVKDILIFILGALTVAWKDVYGYYFGSSVGSDRKTEIMAAASNSQQT